MTSALLLRPRWIIDGTGAPPTPDGTIAVRGDRIEYVGAAGAYAPPSGADVRDLPGKVAMPGLINAHLHFFFCGMCSANAPITLRQLVLNAKVTLAEGVTTAADLGAPWVAIDGFRRWLGGRPDRGPALLAAGPFLTSPGGYPFDYLPPRYADLGGAIAVDSPAHGRRVVAELVAAGADLVKIGMVSRSFNGRPLPCLSDETVRAICDAAHERGRRVLVHAIYAPDWTRAVSLPVDAVVHNALDPLPDETIARAVERRLPVVPTLLVWAAPIERPLEPGFLDQPWVRERLDRALLPDLHAHRKKLEAATEEVPWIVPGVRRDVVEKGNRDSLANLERLHRAGCRRTSRSAGFRTGRLITQRPWDGGRASFPRRCGGGSCRPRS